MAPRTRALPAFLAGTASKANAGAIPAGFQPGFQQGFPQAGWISRLDDNRQLCQADFVYFGKNSGLDVFERATIGHDLC